jgi:hypothetical protein
MAELLIDSGEMTLSEYVRDVVSAELQLLEDISDEHRNISLCSYSFLAE